MLQFDLQFYEELTVAWVRTVKFISGAFFWPTGQLVFNMNLLAGLFHKAFFHSLEQSVVDLICSDKGGEILMKHFCKQTNKSTWGGIYTVWHSLVNPYFIIMHWFEQTPKH